MTEEELPLEPTDTICPARSDKSDDSDQPHGRLHANRLLSKSLHAHRMAAARRGESDLHARRLLRDDGTLTDAARAELRSTAQLSAEFGGELGVAGDIARDVLRFEWECAAPAGQVLTVDNETIDGLIGLAPEFGTRGCDRSCQRWVSACVLARTNAYGSEVAVSLRGPHPALAHDDFDARLAPIQEGAFYGNLYADCATGDPDCDASMINFKGVAWYSCTGRNPHEALETGTARTCASDPVLVNWFCSGFAHVSSCDGTRVWDVGPPSTGWPRSCEMPGGADAPFGACATHGHATDPRGVWFDEVITVYMQDTDPVAVPGVVDGEVSCE